MFSSAVFLNGISWLLVWLRKGCNAPERYSGGVDEVNSPFAKVCAVVLTVEALIIVVN